MKTKNNVQKTVQRMSVIFAVTLLFTFSASAAQIRSKTNLPGKTKSNVHFQLPALSQEAGLILEAWMTDTSNFPACKPAADKTEKMKMKDNNLLPPALVVSSANELPLQMESWMTDIALWSKGK